MGLKELLTSSHTTILPSIPHCGDVVNETIDEMYGSKWLFEEKHVYLN